jgi:hypothetical protein
LAGSDLCKERLAHVSIELVGIVDLGEGNYRLDFSDGGAHVSFVLRRTRKSRGIVIPREFAQHFRGRTSGQDAFEALGRFIDGEQVVLPVQVREDGFTGMGR